MTVLLVLDHAEPRSFRGALDETAIAMPTEAALPMHTVADHPDSYTGAA